jgi:shikimate kinase
MNRPVYLWGLSGSGKSTITPLLAQRMGYKHIDLDTLIEKKHNLSILEIFEKKGENYFRKTESAILLESAFQTAFVMATGGGTPCFCQNADLMLESGICIYLKAGIATLADRLADEKDVRPIFARHDAEHVRTTLMALLNKRKDFYNQADITLSTDDKMPAEIVDELMGLLNSDKQI